MIRGELIADYHMPNRPHFDTIEMKGGGDAVSAARAVIQTGEYDFGWNIQVEDDVLLRLEKGGKGKTRLCDRRRHRIHRAEFTDPNTEVDGERSSMKTKHPLLSDPAVRKALSMLVDREAIKKVHLRPRRARHAPTSSMAPSSSSPRTPLGNSASRRRPSCWKMPGGKPAPTAFAKRTARS